MKYAVLWFLLSVQVLAQPQPTVRLDLPLRQRLDVPQTVAAAHPKLTYFAGFIATAYKVPLLVETTSPVPSLRIASGSFTARQLLNSAVRQLPSYAWEDEAGVGHLYYRNLMGAHGNFLNLQVRRFWFPRNVADFDLDFRACLHAMIGGYGCSSWLITGLRHMELDSERLPYGEPLRNASARTILLRALQANGHFYVLVAYENGHPKLASDFPFVNWFTRSLIPAEPTPMWVQTPRR